MARTYRVNFSVRFSNAIVMFLLRLGIPLRNMRLLTVAGRKSGQLHTVPVVVFDVHGRTLLGSPFGNVNWVQNLRAAGAGSLTHARKTERYSARELPPAEAAPAWKELLRTVPGFIAGYFDVTAASPVEDFEREAPRHPLFELTRTADLQPIGGRVTRAA